jgi:hypothetical protein
VIQGVSKEHFMGKQRSVVITDLCFGANLTAMDASRGWIY